MPIRNEHNFVYMCRIHVTVHMTFLLTRVFSSTFFQVKNIEMSFSQEITTDLWADSEIQPNGEINSSRTNLIYMFLEYLVFLNHSFLLIFWVYHNFFFFWILLFTSLTSFIPLFAYVLPFFQLSFSFFIFLFCFMLKKILPLWRWK